MQNSFSLRDRIWAAANRRRLVAKWGSRTFDVALLILAFLVGVMWGQP